MKFGDYTRSAQWLIHRDAVWELRDAVPEGTDPSDAIRGAHLTPEQRKRILEGRLGDIQFTPSAQGVLAASMLSQDDSTWWKIPLDYRIYREDGERPSPTDARYPTAISNFFGDHHPGTDVQDVRFVGDSGFGEEIWAVMGYAKGRFNDVYTVWTAIYHPGPDYAVMYPEGKFAGYNQASKRFDTLVRVLEKKTEERILDAGVPADGIEAPRGIAFFSRKRKMNARKKWRGRHGCRGPRIPPPQGIHGR